MNLSSNDFYGEIQSMGDMELLSLVYYLEGLHKVLMGVCAYRSALAVSEQIEAIDRRLLPLRNPAVTEFDICYEGPTSPYINAALEHIHNRIENLRQVCAEERASGATPKRIEELEAAMDAAWKFQFLLSAGAFSPASL